MEWCNISNFERFIVNESAVDGGFDWVIFHVTQIFVLPHDLSFLLCLGGLSCVYDLRILDLRW